MKNTKEQGFISKKIDKYRKNKTDKTRVYDRDLAEEMAYAELPYRDKAASKRKVGDAVLKQMWQNWPDLKGDRTVTSGDVAERLDNQVSKPQIESSIAGALSEVANDAYKKAPRSTSDKGLQRHEQRSRDIRDTDPSEVPYRTAQNVGYKLQDQAEELTQKGILVAEAIQQQAQAAESDTNQQHTAKQ
jgi:hypothetical protein